nr:immunoglobulin heavy chain junction region [Mus musculus]
CARESYSNAWFAYW